MTSQLLLNWIARILFFTCLGMLLPTFPIFIKEIGGSDSDIGIVMSTFAIGVLIFRPMIGKQIDTVGRKAVLVGGSVVFVIAPILYIYITSISGLLPIRVFHGLGLAAFGTASITLITDAAPESERTTVISYTGMINTIAMALGPVLGSFISHRWGHAVLFLVVAAFAFVCLAVSTFIHETRSDSKDKLKANYWQAIKRRPILVAFIIVLMVGLFHGGVMFYISTFLDENIEINEGLFFLVFGISAFAVRVVISPIVRKFGRGLSIFMSLVLMMTGILCISQSQSAVLALVAAFFYGLGFGSHQPNLAALVADNTREKTRGKIFSFYYGGFDLGVAMAGFVLGQIAGIYGLRTMFIFGSALAFTAMLVFITMMESDIVASLRCALSIPKPDSHCYICEEFKQAPHTQAEVAPTQVTS